jgi:hypothetical protein
MLKTPCDNAATGWPPQQGVCQTGCMRRLAACLVATALAGCVVVPQTREVYDPDCQVTHKQIVLEAGVVVGLHHCSGDGCAAMMATYGVVAVASAVVSGSIAIVGNVLYWAEKQGRCMRPALASAPK